MKDTQPTSPNPAPRFTERDRLSHDNVRFILETWLDRHSRERFPWYIPPSELPSRVEIPISAVLYSSPNACLCGHPYKRHRKGTRKMLPACQECLCPCYQDKIIHVGTLDLHGNDLTDDSPCPIDHKTTGQINQRFIKQFRRSSQITGYMWNLSRNTGQPVHHAYINAIELSQLPISDNKCRIHSVSYTECRPEHVRYEIIGPIQRTDQQIGKWWDDAIDLALAYRNRLSKEWEVLPTEGTFNGSCSFCEFSEWCDFDQPARQMDKMFQIHPWAPWERAFAGKKGKKPDPLAFYVDNSILQAQASCSTQAHMRYGLGYTNEEQAGPLHAGTAVHKGLERWWLTGDAAVALDAFDEAFGAAA